MENDKIVPADYLPKEQYSINMDVTEAENPRLKINLPADSMFIEVTKTNPPMMVMVCRADKEVLCLGLLEKAKFVLQVFQQGLSRKLDLTRGVSGAVGANLRGQH